MQTVTIVGGNLFSIAASFLGDATQWIRIAQLNQLDDPIILGVVTLLIPSVNPAATGGVVQQ